jgi:hypothetical protein
MDVDSTARDEACMLEIQRVACPVVALKYILVEKDFTQILSRHPLLGSLRIPNQLFSYPHCGHSYFLTCLYTYISISEHCFNARKLIEVLVYQIADWFEQFGVHSLLEANSKKPMNFHPRPW